ncbi:MAG: adenylate/guanylate cyclase domain-containing protein [Candidatus Kapaibacterium sp.]
MNINQLHHNLNQADIANNQGQDYAEAERLCRAVLSAFDELTDTVPTEIHSLRARALRLLAQSIWRRGMMQDALPIAQDALEWATLARDEKEQGITLRDIGHIYQSLGSSAQALEFLNRSVAILTKLGIENEVARAENTIGIVYFFRGDYQHALEFWRSALVRLERIGDQSDLLVRVHTNLGNVYACLIDFPRAIEYYLKALAEFQALNMQENVAQVLSLIGGTYGRSKDYSQSLEYLGRALAIQEELGDKPGTASTLSNRGMVFYYLGEYAKALQHFARALAIQEELHNKHGIANSYICIGDVYLSEGFEGYDLQKAEEYLLRGIAISREIGAQHLLFELHRSLATLYEQAANPSKALEHFKQWYAIEKELLSEEAKAQADTFTREREAAEHEKSLAIERALAKATHEILANILPPNITERLIAGEKKIADSHPDVSVLFVDIVGFTALSSSMPPDKLIDLLDLVFTRFDTICKKHGLEKIKTIGDAYMAVCGAPVSYENHAERAALAALEMLEDFTIEERFSVPVSLGFRIGLHSGSVVAGIIGENKYSYDLWGDAVNTASRMESHGEEDKIHVSEEFMRAVETLHATSLQFIERGEIDIKGKGRMKTYFLEKATL